jgi:ferrous iron transport protein A
LSHLIQSRQQPSHPKGDAFALDHFQVGEQGRITEIKAEADLMQRLAAMGLRAGSVVQVLRKASFSGPLHVRVGTTEVIMRLQEARRIVAVHEVTPLS